jgi:hypothetical protein
MDPRIATVPFYGKSSHAGNGGDGGNHPPSITGRMMRAADGELSLPNALKANGLLSAWLDATPAERVALGIAIGVNRIFADVRPSL